MVEDPIFAGVNSSPPRRGKDSSPDDFDSWCEPFLEEATKVILFVVMLLGDLLVLKGHLARGRALLASLHVVRVCSGDISAHEGSTSQSQSEKPNSPIMVDGVE
ncbi:hypothetical protein V6N13_025286 [Hibiscus sabdariffa]